MYGGMLTHCARGFFVQCSNQSPKSVRLEPSAGFHLPPCHHLSLRTAFTSTRVTPDDTGVQNACTDFDGFVSAFHWLLKFDKPSAVWKESFSGAINHLAVYYNKLHELTRELTHMQLKRSSICILSFTCIFLYHSWRTGPLKWSGIYSHT